MKKKSLMNASSFNPNTEYFFSYSPTFYTKSTQYFLTRQGRGR